MSENITDKANHNWAEIAAQNVEERKEFLAAAAAPAPEVSELLWEWEGRKYPLFLANRTGGIGLGITNPVDRDKLAGRLEAEFAWDNSEVFLDHLDIETIDKAGDGEDWTERENESLIIKNAKLFREIIQFGRAVDFDELGDEIRTAEKNRNEMLNYRKVVQSDLISAWLNEFHIERWFPKGLTSIDAFLSQNIEEVHFVCKVGSKSNPKHVLFFTFNAPNDDQVTAYMTDSFVRGQNNQGDWRYTRDNDVRLRFARKHFRSVKGAATAPMGHLHFEGMNDVRPLGQTDEDITLFRQGFNPNWFIRLGEELAAAFNLAKK